MIRELGLAGRVAFASSVWKPAPARRESWRYLEHVGGCGLLLQRFPQLVEQAGVLDRDDSLVGEGLDKLDLLVGKRPDHFACQSEHSNQYPFPQQWHAKQRSVVAELLCLEPSLLRIREDI